MLNRLSVNVLLKSTIGLLAAAVIIVLASGAWDSWTRLGAATRLTHVTEASSQFFTALHNLRVDRSSSLRDLRSDKANGVSEALRKSRTGEMPELKAGLIALKKSDLANG